MDQSLQEWNDSAPYWEKHAETIRTMFAPVTGALIDEAGIVTGKNVLDVAGGAGEPSLTIAQVVAPSGSVVYTDPIAKMVSAAKAEAGRREITNIEFHQCPADSLPFAENSFDVVVSRLGAMFFPDPLTALGEMLRVTKRRGGLSLVVWGRSEANPFSYVVTNTISHYVEPPPPGSATHDAFRFAESKKLANILKEAGAINIRECLLEFRIAAPISFEGFWDMRSGISGTLREKLAGMSQEDRDAVKRDVSIASREFFPGNNMS